VWYLVLSRGVGREEERKAHLAEHMDWLREAHRSGHVLFSGPTPDLETGIYVMCGASREEVERIAAADPHHIHGERSMEIIEWDARQAMRLAGPSIADIEAMAAGA
jgi:uncharacterized protein YciI